MREAVIEEGLGGVAEASAFDTNYRVSANQPIQLLGDAGFELLRVTPHTFVDDVEGVDDLIAWSTSSSFGNFLSELDAGQRARV